MKEEIVKLIRALCGVDVDDRVLDILCEAACRQLDGQLADHVTADDCAEVYLTAAAWLVMDWLGESRGWDRVTALSAGDMTVRRQGGTGLGKRAMELMAPYLKDRSFVFQGVRG